MEDATGSTCSSEVCWRFELSACQFANGMAAKLVDEAYVGYDECDQVQGQRQQRATSGYFAAWWIYGAITQVTKYIRRVHEMSIPECGSVTALCGLCVFVQPLGVKGLACPLCLERVLSL